MANHLILFYHCIHGHIKETSNSYSSFTRFWFYGVLHLHSVSLQFCSKPSICTQASYSPIFFTVASLALGMNDPVTANLIATVPVHYNDVTMTTMASHITSLTVVYSTVYSDADKKTSKLRVTGLCVGKSSGPVNSPHKWPVTRKMFPFDDVIMELVLLGMGNTNR